MKRILNELKSVILFLLLIQLNTICEAQVDTVFWFAAPEVSSTHADRPIYFQIATLNNPSTVNISIPAAGITMVNNFTIPANSSQSFDVTAFINNLETPSSNINQVLNKGVLITATELITAYYEVLGTVYLYESGVVEDTLVVNTDIFSLKGSNSLGTEFYVPFQNKFSNSRITNWGTLDVNSAIDIVATEDNTTITVYPTQPYRVGTGSSTAVINITLNKGQTYSIEAFGALGSEHMSGTRIVSNKKIAVTMKDDSIGSPSAHDLAGDQIIPVVRTGSEYIVFGGHAFITATEDNTAISVGGIDQGVSLLKGQTYSLNLQSISNAVFIVTSKPAYMNHLIEISGEMGNAVMPPLQCTGSKSVTVNRSSANFGEIFYLYITVKQGSEDDFTVTNSLFPGGNATIINGVDFQPVPGTGGEWLFDTLAFPYNDLSEIPLGGNIISNSTGIFHLGILNGKGLTTGGTASENQATGFRYGYFTDFGNLTITLNIPNQCITAGDSVQVYPGDFVSYEWSTGSTDTAVFLKHSGNYSVKVTDTAGCWVTENFYATLDKIPEFSLGPDIFVCGDQEVTLNTYETNFWQLSYVDFNWKDGGTDSVKNVHQPGEYILTAKNGCGNNSDTINVIMVPITPNNLFTPNGDNLNETFVLDGLDLIGEWELIIYNRWGDRVYQNDLYKNNWDGLNVKEGVYYFHFQDKSEQCQDKKGWVQIVK